MKNSADLGGCYPPLPSPSVDNTLLDLQNSSYPTQPHSVIANYNFNPCGSFEKMTTFSQILEQDLDQGKLMADVNSRK